MSPNMFGNPTKRDLLDQVQQLNAELVTSRDAVDALQGMVETNQHVDNVAKLAREALRRKKDEGIIDGLVEIELATQVDEPLQRDTVMRITDSLREERKTAAVAQTRDPDWLAVTRTKIDGMLKVDGTYDRIDKSVKADAIKAVTADLVAERELDIDVQSGDRQKDPKIIAAASQLADAEISAYKLKIDQMAIDELTRQKVERGKAQIDDEVRMTVSGELPAATEAWLKTKQATSYRQSRLEAARSELAAEIAEAAKPHIEAEARRQASIELELLSKFETVGVPTASIPKGSVVEMVLGAEKYQPSADGEYDRYNKVYKQIPESWAIDTKRPFRTLKFVALDEGRYRVKADSLATSTSPYEQSLSLAGTVVCIGRQEKDAHNGTSGLDQAVAKGEIPFVDVDTTSPEIIDSLMLPVQVFVIDGIMSNPKFDIPRT